MGKKVMREHMGERLGVVNNFCDNPPLPESLNIELNNTCNQKCIFCSFHGKYGINKLKPAIISYETAIEILNQAKSLGIGEKEVGFYLAGEAFLHKDLDRIIDYAKRIGFKYTFITTNGALATPDKMKKVLDAGLDSIRFSINATDRKTYELIHGKDDFEKVVENLKYMNAYIKENNIDIATSLSCVLTKRTSNIKEEINRMFSEYVDDIMFIPVTTDRLQKDPEFIDTYQLIDDSNAEINKEYVCPVIFDTMYINANLEVVPCCNAYDYNCVFYDLKKDFSLENAWNSEGYRKYRNIFLKGDDDSDTICKKCLLRMKGVERLMN